MSQQHIPTQNVLSQLESVRLRAEINELQQRREELRTSLSAGGAAMEQAFARFVSVGGKETLDAANSARPLYDTVVAVIAALGSRIAAKKLDLREAEAIERWTVTFNRGVRAVEAAAETFKLESRALSQRFSDAGKEVAKQR